MEKSLPFHRTPRPFFQPVRSISPTTSDVFQAPKSVSVPDMTVPVQQSQLTWELNRPSAEDRGTTPHTLKAAPALPPELLNIVFLFAHYYMSNSNDYCPKDISRLPLIISHVSQLWRDVAVGIAVLWTDIHISPPCSLDLLGAYLNRSGSCSIDLSIYLRYHTNPTGFDDIRWVIALCSTLSPHLHRCHSISMVCHGDWGTRDKLLQMFSVEPFPCLQRFAIDGPSSALQLTASTLDELRIKNPLSTFPELQVDSITVLHLDTTPFNYNSLCDLLLRCPALNVLALYNYNYNGWPDPPLANVIYLPNLRSLQLYAVCVSVLVSGMLLFIDAPNLVELTIAPVGPNDLRLLWPWGDSPKFTSVKSLTVATTEPIDYEVLPFAYQCFPSVENLTLPVMYDKPFARMFTGLVKGRILWPQLRTLSLRGIDHLTEDLVLQMVQFRKSAGFPLETLYLDSESLGMYSLPLLRREVMVNERDSWEVRRREALYSEFPKRFISWDETWEL